MTPRTMTRLREVPAGDGDLDDPASSSSPYVFSTLVIWSCSAKLQQQQGQIFVDETKRLALEQPAWIFKRSWLQFITNTQRRPHLPCDWHRQGINSRERTV